MTVFYLDGFVLSFLVKTKKGSQARLVTRNKMAMDCHGYYEHERQQSTHHLQSHNLFTLQRCNSTKKLFNHYISDQKIFYHF